MSAAVAAALLPATTAARIARCSSTCGGSKSRSSCNSTSRSSPCARSCAASRRELPSAATRARWNRKSSSSASHRVASFERGGEGVRRALELARVGQRSEPGLLEHEPEPEEIGDVLDREIGDDDASMRVVRDQPVLGEAAQRFSQRVARHTERARDLRLAQVRPGHEPAVEDHLAEHALDLRARRRPLERRDCRVHASSPSTEAIRSSARPRKSGSKPTVRRR